MNPDSSSPDKKEIERESEAAFGERPFAQLRSAAKTKKLIFDAVESGDAGTIHRFLQRNEFPGALHKNFYPDEKELSGLKNLLLRFFYEAAEASIRGGFDPEEAETLFEELSGRLNQATAVEDLVSLEKLVISTYGDPFFRKTTQRHCSLPERVNRFISENYMQKLTITQISNALCLHPNYLMKKYKAESGKSIMQAVNDKRISEAMKLLLTTEISIDRISKKIGFETPQYFNTVFKKRMGKSPNQARREAKTSGRRKTDAEPEAED